MSDAHPTPTTSPAPSVIGVELIVVGQVQGVGFRPFVFRVATSLQLTGSVRNDPSGVVILLYGAPTRIDAFERRLLSERPPLARIDAVSRRQISPAALPSFSIVASERTGRPDRVTVDSATCADCLRELTDPNDRRFEHALINCTNCGPRYTIVLDVPYDRPFTTMAAFPMCNSCAREYSDPTDRRFHAQPTCCNHCGPRVQLIDAAGITPEPRAVTAAAAILKQGGVLAVKGLGGYHLAVDASDPEAVARLRARKRRDHKPFAVLVDSLATASELVRLSPAGAEALVGPIAPIVLADRRPNAPVAPSVAPGMGRLGVMLPHTPLQHLLVRQGLKSLVMTSANLSDDPLIIDDQAAIHQLAGIADGWLSHNRPIARAVDDSVMLDSPLGLVPIRRARGMAPTPVRLNDLGDVPGVCMGGELKSAVAVVTGGQAVLSQHVGDLSHPLAFARFRDTITDLLNLFRVAPRWIARDAHPAYLSHRFAKTLSTRLHAPIIDVHHHHAHMAAVMAEHGASQPAVGIICDGVGYGDDGESWGCEVLVGDLVSFSRRARMRPLRLPGGDAAARQTGRCAVSWLHDALGPAFLDTPLASRLIPPTRDRTLIADMLARNVNCPPSSGLGRLFDAAAALLGVCDHNHFEAMSGMRLEAIAAGAPSTDDPSQLIPLSEHADLIEMDHRPLALRLIRGLDRGEPLESLARLFHEAVASALVRAGDRVAQLFSLGTIALSGGVFCNALIASLVHDALVAKSYRVLVHREVPPNDGGLALGQAAVASARFKSGWQGV